MYNIIHTSGSKIQATRINEHENYEYIKHAVIPGGKTKQCEVLLYELTPGKSAYPYHYHAKNEEVYYIISGQGVIRTPDGESLACAGDFIFFPADEKGAHKLTNTSNDTNLVYIDFHTDNDLEVVFYPDSEKIGVYGKNICKLYKEKNDIDYYDGE